MAYVYYKDYDDYKEGRAAIKIGVLDQTWPQSDKLPFQTEISERLNSQTSPNYPHGLNHALARNLKKLDSDFDGKYYSSVQFFNNFTFLAHSTLGLTSRVILFKENRTMRVTELADPWCELVLGIDQANEHVYYLSNEKKPQKSKYRFENDHKTLQNMVRDIKANGRAMIVKYSLKNDKEVKRCYI